MAKKLAPTRTKLANSRVIRTNSSANHQLMVVVSTVLLLALAFVSLKYFLAKKSWMNYGTQAQDVILNEPNRSAIDDAATVAETTVNFPAENPLWKQPKLLQNYVEVIGAHGERDVVIVDETGKILADTVATNVGRQWSEDKDGEVLMTIKDGKPRDFEEKSVDFPAGLMQVVVPVRIGDKIVGAVIYSSQTTP